MSFGERLARGVLGGALSWIIGGILTAIGVIVVLLAFFSMIVGLTGSGGSVGAIFGAIGGAFVGLIVGVLFLTIGGFFLRFWWVFVLAGAVSGGGNTVAERRAMRGEGDIRVRCRNCGRLNPEEAKFCLGCGKPI